MKKLLAAAALVFAAACSAPEQCDTNCLHAKAARDSALNAMVLLPDSVVQAAKAKSAEVDSYVREQQRTATSDERAAQARAKTDLARLQAGRQR